jgi:hypothetical protein
MRARARLQELCEQRLRGIAVPQPFGLDEFAAEVAAARGRPLRVLPLPELDDGDVITGAWVSTDTDDWVLTDASASPWHRDLIGLHEIAHLLCGHCADAQWLQDFAASLLPDLSDVTIRHMLGRHGYTTAEELEAEFLGSLILERADADPVMATSPGRDGAAGRLAHTLRHPVRDV